MAIKTPMGWVNDLEKALARRWRRSMSVPDAYYEGDHKLTFAGAKFREAFGSLFGPLADNWCEIVVDSPVERLTVQGFRFGDEHDADKDAWDIWQANGLDDDSDMLHTDSVKLGEAYWLVDAETAANGSYPRRSDDPPRITAEHPAQMIVAYAPGDRRQRNAALKRWRDEDDGYLYATLYLPDGIYKYKSQQKAESMAGGNVNWQRNPDDPGGRNVLGVVPVIPICNNPSLMGSGRSDLTRGIVSVQNAVNKILCDLIIGSEYQGFPQRVLLGVDEVVGPDGQPISAQQASQQRLWVFENEDAKVAEFAAADLDKFGNTIDMLVRHLTAQSKTPPHYVVGQVVNASGDALKAAETGLVAKTRRKMRPFGEGHEEAMRLSFKAIGDDTKASATNNETIWADPESRSQAELADALSKLASIGVPEEVLWERYGFSPQEIDRMRTMKEAQAFTQLTQPPPPGQVPPPQQQQGNGAPPVAVPAIAPVAKP